MKKHHLTSWLYSSQLARSPLTYLLLDPSKSSPVEIDERRKYATRRETKRTQTDFIWLFEFCFVCLFDPLTHTHSHFVSYLVSSSPGLDPSSTDHRSASLTTGPSSALMNVKNQRDEEDQTDGRICTKSTVSSLDWCIRNCGRITFCSELSLSLSH